MHVLNKQAPFGMARKAPSLYNETSMPMEVVVLFAARSYDFGRQGLGDEYGAYGGYGSYDYGGDDNNGTTICAMFI